MNDTNYDFETQLQLYLGGELEPKERQWIEAQLEADGDCRAMLESATRARSAYLAHGSEAESELRAEPLNLWPGIRARMQSEGLLDASNSGAFAAASSSREASAAGPDGLAHGLAHGLAGERSAPLRGRILRFAGALSTAAALALFSLPLWRQDSALVSPSASDFAQGQADAQSSLQATGDSAGLPSGSVATKVQQDGAGAQAALASSGAPEPTLTKGGLQPVLLGEETMLERLVRLEREAGLPTAVPFDPNQMVGGQMVGGSGTNVAPRTHRRLE